MNEERTTNRLDVEIRTILLKSKYIYMLGFGYDSENINILTDEFTEADIIWGTSYKLGESLKKETKDHIFRRMVKKDPNYVADGNTYKRIELFDLKCAEFVKEKLFLY